MDDPASEISGVIHALTQTPPSTQKHTIYKYFAPNASFLHPFCRTGSFEYSDRINSRFLIHAIYRWYKIMSPEIELEINSIAYDAKNLILYVHISQVFRIWTAPFYKAPVQLVTVLQLVRDNETKKYFIQSQNDLYQVNEFVRFFWFGGWLVLWIWQIIAAFFCLLGAIFLGPVTWVEEKRLRNGWKGLAAS